MNDDEKAVERERRWVISERGKRGWSTIKLADVARAIAHREGRDLKLRQQSISDFEQPGKAKRIPEWLRYARMAFEEGEPAAQSDTDRRDELVYVKQLDIKYAFGHGAVIDEHPAAVLIPFNLSFIQGVTRTPTDRLFLATGFGDSMEPVLLKHDLVLIDTNDRGLDVGDFLWALNYAGSGYIKRLRPVMRDGKRKIMILSVNPEYPPEEADPADVHVIGKVALVIRRP